MIRATLLLIPLAGCAAPACRPVSVAIPFAAPSTIQAPDTRGPDALIAEYAALRRDERRFVAHAGPGHIRQLIKLDKAARGAMQPVAASDHVATQAELQHAIAALGALRAFMAEDSR